MRVRMAGFGGQGQVTAGILLGHSVVLEGRHVLQTQSYGSATRGGLTTCDVCTGDAEILEVHPERFDVLVAFSQEACDAFVPLLEEDGVLIYEQDLVTPPADLAQRCAASPTTRLAKDELGKVICANVVMLGFLIGSVPAIVDPARVETAIEQQLASKIVSLNLDAFRLGHSRAQTNS